MILDLAYVVEGDYEISDTDYLAVENGGVLRPGCLMRCIGTIPFIFSIRTSEPGTVLASISMVFLSTHVMNRVSSLILTTREGAPPTLLVIGAIEESRRVV